MCKVSVIINCYNGERYLKETLESVKNQSFDDYEIVFWDNCSSDRTGQIARQFGDKMRYFRGEKTVPLGEARNLALRQTKGEYIAFLDSDDLWDSGKLALQVKEMNKSPDVGLVCSNYQMHNMMTQQMTVFDKNAVHKKIEFSEFVTGYSYCLSSFMIRKTALEELEYCFHDSLKYAEEYELFVRIAYKWKIIYMPQVLVTYRIHSSMSSMHLKEEQYNEYNVVLDSLRRTDPHVDSKYPEVVRWISFVRDLAGVKDVIRNGDNKKVRELMSPYLNYNIRAKCFFFVALFPAAITKKLVAHFYKKRF